MRSRRLAAIFGAIALASVVVGSWHARATLRAGYERRRLLSARDHDTREDAAFELTRLGPPGLVALEELAFSELPRPPRQAALDALWSVDERLCNLEVPFPPDRLRRYLLEARGLARDGPLLELEFTPPERGAPLVDAAVACLDDPDPEVVRRARYFLRAMNARE